MWLLAACRLPDFNGDAEGEGIIALDTTVDRLQVLAVRTTPPLAPQGQPRLVEALVADPTGTRGDLDVAFSVCGLSETVSVGVTDLRCFENPALVQPIDADWAVPAITFPDCVPFDETGFPDGHNPGEFCLSEVPVRAEVAADGETASGANYVSIPVEEIPQIIVVDGEEVPATVFTDASFADPTLPVTLTGEANGGGVALEVEIEDPHYNRVAWWATGGTFTQSGRTLVERAPGEAGRAYNEWIAPDDGEYTVWVVLTEWRDPVGEVPDAFEVLVSQPAWAALEVSR